MSLEIQPYALTQLAATDRQSPIMVRTNGTRTTFGSAGPFQLSKSLKVKLFEK
jgi:hypothetical protein